MSDLSGKVVLVVDDSSSIRREVRVILQKEGLTVREAGTEFGAFNSILEYGVLVDIILMDLSLNDVNGFDLVDKIRAVERFKDIPIIMLTQHSDRVNVVKAKNMGIQGYIVKPINPHILIERIGQVLG
jgi:two-component system chemotaxis response regulator CheY